METAKRNNLKYMRHLNHNFVNKRERNNNGFHSFFYYQYIINIYRNH